jgi:putative inorganic carbon (hco3(-)) transporter
MAHPPERLQHNAPSVRSRRSVGRRSKNVSTQQLLELKAGLLWQFMTQQSAAFWFMCLYVVVEYVRPQQLFAPIYGAPLGQFVLAAALIAWLGSGKGLQVIGGGSVLMLAFTGAIVLSALTAYDPSVSWDGMRVWISWVVIFFLIVNIVDSNGRFVVFMLIWLLCHYYMSQGGAKQFVLRGFTFAKWGVVGAPGWFHNSGEFGIAMCMFAVVSMHFYVAARPHLTRVRKFIVLGMPLTAVLGVMGSSSRGAVVALAAAAAWAVVRGKNRVRGIAFMAVAAGVFWAVLPDQQKERFARAGEDETSVSRKTYWAVGIQIAKDHPVTGIGYSNWLRYYGDAYPDQVSSSYGVQLSHNIFIQCAAELGAIGLAIFIAMIAGTLVINYRTRQAVANQVGPPAVFVRHIANALDGAMVCYLVAGFFVTVLYYPFFWINLAMTVALRRIALGTSAPGVIRRRRHSPQPDGEGRTKQLVQRPALPG